MQWLNEPATWQRSGEHIHVHVEPGTDFWRTTHYGFIRDTGHVYYTVTGGDFIATTKIAGAYRDLYDQAGLMVRIDAEHWVKTGIEFVHGVQYVSAVVTNVFSDWSVAPLVQNPPAVWLRLIRKAEAVEIFYSLDGADYTLLRIAYLLPSAEAMVGVMCAAPDGTGFDVVFEEFDVQPLDQAGGH
jgi:regulation of enolase protein 1 (concanavalin A-like superfamily)